MLAFRVLRMAGWKVVLRAAGAREMRGDLLSAHVELGHGHRTLRESGDRAFHSISSARTRCFAGRSGRCSFAWGGIPVNRREPAGFAGEMSASSRAATSSCSPWRRRARGGAPTAGSRASIGSRARRAFRWRSPTSTIRAQKSASARISSSPAMCAADMARIRDVLRGAAGQTPRVAGTGPPARGARREVRRLPRGVARPDCDCGPRGRE